MVEFELLLAMAVDAPALIPLPHCELDVLRDRLAADLSIELLCHSLQGVRPLQLEPLTVSLLAHEGANVCRCEREIIGQVCLLLKEPHVAEEVDADLLGRRSERVRLATSRSVPILARESLREIVRETRWLLIRNRNERRAPIRALTVDGGQRSVDDVSGLALGLVRRVGTLKTPLPHRVDALCDRDCVDER